MASAFRGLTRRTRPNRRVLRIISGAAATFAVGWVFFASFKIVFPSQGELDDHSDAVVSLAPQYFRLPMAEQIFKAGNADFLVISYFPEDRANRTDVAISGVRVSDYCESRVRENVVCFTPEDSATIGEALSIRDIAHAESWHSVTIVTNQYHVFRTRFIFERCLGKDIDVNVVFSERELSFSQWVWHILYENSALLKAAFQTTFRC